MSNNYLISDAAKQVKVEAHVLRYWEEELGLPIKRNELGHRYYTAEDVEQFKEIKDLKERGLQLKAIRMILKNGKLDMLAPGTAAAARKLQEDKPASQADGGRESSGEEAETHTASERAGKNHSASGQTTEKGTASERTEERYASSGQTAEKHASSGRTEENYTSSGQTAGKHASSGRTEENYTSSGQTTEKGTASERTEERDTSSGQTTEKHTASGRTTEKKGTSGKTSGKNAVQQNEEAASVQGNNVPETKDIKGRRQEEPIFLQEEGRHETEVYGRAERRITENREEQYRVASDQEMQEHTIITGTEAEKLYNPESREQKAQRLQWLLQQLFRETLQENNKELCRIMKENILKEMDYQFRVQEEREDERHNQRIKQEEEHFKKIDELLRKKRRLLKK